MCKPEFAHNHAINQSTSFIPFCVIYGAILRGPIDLGVALDATRDHGQTIDFVTNLSFIHAHVHKKFQVSSTKYKAAADRHHRDIQFNVGDLVWVVLTKDIFPLREYKKLKSRKIEPLEILEKININAYHMNLPSDIRCSDVFNVNILFLVSHKLKSKIRG